MLTAQSYRSSMTTKARMKSRKVVRVALVLTMECILQMMSIAAGCEDSWVSGC